MPGLTPEMKKVIEKAHGLVYVGTVGEDGKPNISPRYIVEIIEENGGQTIVYGDNYRNKTYENLTRDPRVTVAVADPEIFSGYQFKGKADIERSGSVYEKVRKKFIEGGYGDQPAQGVAIHVEEIYSLAPAAASKEPLAQGS
ncbi:MAG: pyridoxamine 5'-phosphate oxidase family protein [Firmicutes bacterium]|nr:pyridoxamine 5'-phosphate oxidase family protein [Bacillota bacterium]